MRRIGISIDVPVSGTSSPLFQSSGLGTGGGSDSLVRTESIDTMCFVGGGDQFERVARLGSGCFSEVFLARDRSSGELVAVKSVTDEMFWDGRIDPVGREHEVNKRLSLLKLQHGALFGAKLDVNIVDFFGYFLADNHVCFVFEYMEHGSLEDLINRLQLMSFPQEVLAIIGRDTLAALTYLHEASEQIIHRDLRPANLLVSRSGRVKLSDFNTARILRESSARTYTGSTDYMAPERIAHLPHSTSSDIWSLGLTIYALAVGGNPYSGMSTFDMSRSLMEESPPALDPDEGFSEDIIDFVEACLQKNPDCRPSARKLLSHPFILSAADSSSFESWIENGYRELGISSSWEEIFHEHANTSHVSDHSCSASEETFSAGIPIRSSVVSGVKSNESMECDTPSFTPISIYDAADMSSSFDDRISFLRLPDEGARFPSGLPFLDTRSIPHLQTNPSHRTTEVESSEHFSLFDQR